MAKRFSRFSTSGPAASNTSTRPTIRAKLGSPQIAPLARGAGLAVWRLSDGSFGAKTEAGDVQHELPHSADSCRSRGHYRAAGVDPKRPFTAHASDRYFGPETTPRLFYLTLPASRPC